jgi:aromatic ring-opening dioxygenase catalytic subunit (LigB family)
MKLPVFFLSHGGGPWHVIPDMREEFAHTEALLRRLSESLPAKPSAILMISAHWEEDEFTVSTATHPRMIYDYGGFPEYTYQLQYPAAGAPVLAKRVQGLIELAGLRCALDADRGFDHGAFVPLMVMYPQADVPVQMLSMKSNYSSSEHMQLGAALASLRDEGVLIICSGYTYHNMRGFGRPESRPASFAFEAYLNAAVTADSQTREQMLIDWANAPFARACHPREDHLIPLMVAAGAAGEDRGKRLLLDEAFGVVMGHYQFG